MPWMFMIIATAIYTYKPRGTYGSRNGVELETNILVSYSLYCTVKSYNFGISSHHQRVNSFWKKAYSKILH